MEVGDTLVWTPRFDGLDRKAHAEVVDEFRNRHRERAFALVSAAVAEGGVHVIAALSPGLAAGMKAGEIMKRLGLKGGGRPDFAQGGGVAPGEVDDLRRRAAATLREILEAATNA
jgi:alanyl-tRNA synthetase